MLTRSAMRKPHEVAKALARHPDKVVIFIDVDCVVHGPLDALANIRGDVAFYVRTKYRRNGGMRFGTRSETVVFRPTEMARTFVDNWIAAAKEAPWGDVDQTPLAIAIGRTPGAHKLVGGEAERLSPVHLPMAGTGRTTRDPTDGQRIRQRGT